MSNSYPALTSVTPPAEPSRPSISRLPAVGLALTVPVATWFVVGDQSTGDDYAVGPYHLNLLAERVVGVVALVVLVASAVAALRARRRTSERDLRASAVGLVCVATCLAAYGWRVITAGAIGANIGAGLFAFGLPIVLAGLLATAVFLQRTYRRKSRPGLDPKSIL